MSESESEVEAAHPRVQTRHLTRVYRRVTSRLYRRGAAPYSSPKPVSLGHEHIFEEFASSSEISSIFTKTACF